MNRPLTNIKRPRGIFARAHFVCLFFSLHLSPRAARRLFHGVEAPYFFGHPRPPLAEALPHVPEYGQFSQADWPRVRKNARTRRTRIHAAASTMAAAIR